MAVSDFDSLNQRVCSSGTTGRKLYMVNTSNETENVITKLPKDTCHSRSNHKVIAVLFDL